MDETWRDAIERHKIIVNIDEGSGYQKITGLHLQGDEDPDSVGIDTIQLQPGRNEIEQKAVFDDDGELLCGEEHVAFWHRRHPGEAHRIVENWKLALCRSFENSWPVKKIYKALGANHGELGDIQKFVTAKFRQARAGVPKWYKESPKSLKYPPQYWDEIVIEAKITVPCMWGSSSIFVMRNAAIDAGFKNVQLLLEPLCAAALDVLLLRDKGYIKPRVPITFIDIGHATIDMATVCIHEPRTPGARCPLEIIGTPTGELLGSHVIHDMAWDYVQTCPEFRQHGGMDRTLFILGRMSKEEISRQVSSEIEIRKKIHPPVDFSITINAMADWHKVPGGTPHFSIRIEGQVCITWAAEWPV